jgi:hypothetical protein
MSPCGWGDISSSQMVLVLKRSSVLETKNKDYQKLKISAEAIASWGFSKEAK